MQNAGFNFGKNVPLNEKTALQNGQQVNPTQVEEKQPQQSTSIFNKNQTSADINQSNNNSGGTGGVINIFAGGGGFTSASMDNTSIFSGLNRGSNYSLYNKKDSSFDIPKLTQEDIANQKTSSTPLRTNPKATNIHITTKANPYEAYRNPEMQETSLSETLSNAFANLFGQKKAN